MKILIHSIFLFFMIACGSNQEPITPKTDEVLPTIDPISTTEVPNESINNSIYQKLTFKTLNGFRLLKKPTPSIFDVDVVKETDQEKAEQINKQVPEEIKKLNGTSIEISGFAFPVKLVGGKAKELVLMCVIPSCCFGDDLRVNDIIYVFSPNSNLALKQNQFLKIKGKLTVEAKFDADRSSPFLYWLNADKVELSKPGL